MKYRYCVGRSCESGGMIGQQPIFQIGAITMCSIGFAIAILVTIMPTQSSASDAMCAEIFGLWSVEEDGKADARIRISDCGGKICGKIVWMLKPRLDVRNKDPNLRTRCLIDVMVIWDFEPILNDDGKCTSDWGSGKIYNPDDEDCKNPNSARCDPVFGEWLTAKIRLINGNRHLLLPGKHRWKRINAETPFEEAHTRCTG